MEDLIRSLEELGLVETEARAYLALATRSPLSGYQVAKECGLSRGNVYAVLKRLVEKGAARQTTDERYVAVALADFLEGRLATVDRSARLLQEKLPQLNPDPMDVIAPVRGRSAILARATEMLEHGGQKVYLAAFPSELAALERPLWVARERGINVCLLGLGGGQLPGRETGVDRGEESADGSTDRRFIALAVDKDQALAGEVDDSGSCLASWSRNRHFCLAISLYVSQGATP